MRSILKMHHVSIFILLLQSTLAHPRIFDMLTYGPTSYRHYMDHDHKILCNNCFCGGNAIRIARHHCPSTRDLVRCPSDIRKCYRCSCVERNPLTPAPSPRSSSVQPAKKSKGADDKSAKSKKSASSSPTPTGTPSASPSATVTPSASVTPSMSMTPSVSVTPSVSMTPSVSVTPSPSMTPYPSATSSSTPSSSPIPTSSPAPSSSPTATSSPTASPTPTAQEDCTTLRRKGIQGAVVVPFETGATSGTFSVTYKPENGLSRVDIQYEGEVVYSTIPDDGGAGIVTVTYAGEKSVLGVLLERSEDVVGGVDVTLHCPLMTI